MKRLPEEDMLPWMNIAEIAFGILRIEPSVFWDMTPPEWMAALSGWKRLYGIGQGADPFFPRADIQEMMGRFPDIIEPENDPKAF